MTNDMNLRSTPDDPREVVLTLPSAVPIVATIPEEWRPIEGFQGRYEISNHGRARSWVRKGPRGRPPRDEPLILQFYRHPQGYIYTLLRTEDHRYKAVYLHAAVAAAFIGPLPPGFHCAHLDGNPANPCLENLSYVTPKENWTHRRVHGTAFTKVRGERQGHSKLTDDAVRELRRLRETGLTWRVLGPMFGVSQVAARHAGQGTTWAHVK